MPRIFKGIESELRLLLHPCILTGEITDIKVALFTNDPSVAIEFTDRYTIDDNILTLKVPTWAFGTMEDGVINYVIQGMHNDDAFITDRQSNYYLKTPTDYIPEEMPEEVVLGELTTKIVENGVFEYTPTDVDAWNKATIEVNVPDTNGSYDEGYNQGYEDGQNSVECPEGGSCNLGEGEIYLTANDAGFYELYAAEDGYDGWSKFYVTLVNGGAIKVHKAEDLVNTFNNGEQIDYGAYYYVGGKITEIQEINVEFGNATYILDNGFKVYRGKWIDDNPFDEDQIKVGGYIVVYGIIQDYKGQLQFKADSQVIAYQECEGGEIVSCNLEEIGIRPSMGDRDANGVIVVEESEGFDGLSRVVIDPTTIYNEGVSAGKIEGGDLTIGTGDIYLTANERGQRFEILPSEWEYDAFDKFIVEMENFDLGGDANIYEASMVNDLLMGGNISYGNRYLFKGQITEIQRIRPEYGDARYTLDGSLNVYNGQTMGYDLQVGDNVIVIGTLSEYNGAPQFSAGSMIKVWWREGGSCNLEDKWVTPSMGERDDNGFIVVNQSEGYDGLDRVVIDPTTIYNEGVEEGRNQGGGSGDCNIQNQKKVDLNGEWEVFRPDEGYDGVYEVVVDAINKSEEWREEGRNDVRDRLQSIEITENGRYSVEDQIMVNSLRYNGGYHTDTISTYDINRIEVTFKADTSGSINEQGQPFILGGSMWGLNESGEDNECARAIQYAYGRIVGYWEGKWTDAVPCMDGEWLTITLDENGMTIKYPTYERYCEYTHDNGKVNGGENIFPFIIGGQGRRAVGEDGNYTSNLIEDSQFRGLIKDVKINTNSMGEITYISKNWGYGVWDRLVVNTGEYLSALEPTEGEVTMNSEWERKYGEGWKEINVNVDTQASCPSVQEQVDQYTRPAVIFEGVTEVFVEEPHKLQTDDLVETTAWISTKDTVNNKWCLWTKEGKYEGVSVLNGSAFGGDYFEAKCIRLTGITKLLSSTFFPISAEEIHFGNIEYIETSAIESMNELKKIFYTGDGNVTIDNNAIRGANPNGTLYLKNGVDETPWLERLPEGWVVERLNDDGSVNCGGDIEDYAKNEARVLNITENGVYTSRYSNESEFIMGDTSQVTGIYDDGTEFYDTAVIYGALIPLNIVPTVDSRIEFWYLPNKPHMGDGFHQIIQSTNDQIAFVFDAGGINNKTLRFIFGDKSVYYTPSNIGDEWWHIIVDKNGLIFNGEEFPFDATATFKKAETNVYVNGNVLNSRKANGTFGMVKIDGTTFIPKEGGYLNLTTNELCPFEQYNIGILDDGTPITKGGFLDYSVYDTGLKITEDSVIDMWFVRPTNGIVDYVFKSPIFNVRYDSNRYYIMTNGVEQSVLEFGQTHESVINITISKADGFKKIGTYATKTISLSDAVLSSGNHTLLLDSKYNTYGLIKIDGNVIIPTENGFLNTTTNEYLKKVEEYDGEYVYMNPFYEYVNNTEKTPIEIDGNLIKTVNVNVVPKIKVADEKFSFRGAQFTKIPEWADIDGIENMYEFLLSCNKLTEIRWFDASRTTNMTNAFMYCSAIVSFPPLNTIRVATMNNMLDGCTNLVSVPPLDARSRNNTTGIFGSWTLDKLTDFGGLIGLKTSMNGTDSFNRTPNLTYESCINILNGLYDFTGNGITPDSNQGKLKVHSNFLTTVGDEISIGTAKGWTITA